VKQTPLTGGGIFVHGMCLNVSPSCIEGVLASRMEVDLQQHLCWTKILQQNHYEIACQSLLIQPDQNRAFANRKKATILFQTLLNDAVHKWLPAPAPECGR
jgi:hypothetical protein